MEKRKRVFALIVVFLIGFSSVLLGRAPSEEMRQEIIVLNLVNGLDLTPNQMEAVLKFARESDELRQRFQSVLLQNRSQMEQALSEIQTYLKANEEIPLSTKQEYHRLANEIKQARLEMDEGIRRRAEQVRNILKPHQVYQLQQFVPCIIPPQGELRIGQAENHKGLARQMERIRSLPHRVYERQRARIVSRTLKAMKLHAPRSVEINEEEMRAHIQRVFDDVRSLEETEFEVQKEELAKRLLAPLKKPEYRDSLMRKIESFLLSAEVVPLLEERIARAQGNGST